VSGGATPGPWAVFHREPRKGVFGEVAADFIHAGPEPRDDTGFNVVARAYTTHGFDGIAEREANARLIAAAPTMREFIARIAERDDSLGDDARQILEAIDAHR
jgi:hypothetical protein